MENSNTSNFLECSILMMNEGANGDDGDMPQTPFSPDNMRSNVKDNHHHNKNDNNNVKQSDKRPYNKSKFSC